MSDNRGTTEGYYSEQAITHGLASQSTMPDELVRERELAAIRACLTTVATPTARLLEIGCGNGLLLSTLRAWYPAMALSGIDSTHAMVELARSRAIAGASLQVADVMHLPFADGVFDVMVSERVIINLLSRDDQRLAFAESARVLRSGGYFVCIEGFAEPLRRLNQARAELCLPPILMPAINRWFEDDDFAAYLDGRFDVVSEPGVPPPSFLSSHYFITRVFHDAIRPEQGKLRNTHLARFFSEALPPVGDYAPVKLHLLRRR